MDKHHKDRFIELLEEVESEAVKSFVHDLRMEILTIDPIDHNSDGLAMVSKHQVMEIIKKLEQGGIE